MDEKTNQDMEVRLVQPYDPSWPLRFKEIRAFVASGLGGVAHEMEHVGSTAVFGMTAKPVIDLDVVIPANGFAEVKTRLESLGYIHQGDQGLPGREAFKLMDENAKSRLYVHHLYVCEKGAYELRKHLAFRDFLRENPAWRDRLCRLKRELCRRHDNHRQAYIDGKSAMVAKITQLAMESGKNRANAVPGG